MDHFQLGLTVRLQELPLRKKKKNYFGTYINIYPMVYLPTFTIRINQM